jgi:ankyrin repeat protein
LVRKFPDIVSYDISYGWCLLHYCCYDTVRSDELFFHIWNMYPVAVEKLSYNGWYPLHLALYSKKSSTIIETLLNRFPAAASRSVVRTWIDIKPDMNNEDMNLYYNCYPLHLACYHYTLSENCMIDLIAAYPNAVMEQNGLGEYPINIAIHNCHSENVVLMLLHKFPKAVLRIGSDGRNLLHNAIVYTKSTTILLSILEYFPEIANRKDDGDCYPLHYACSELKTVLFEIYKAFVLIADPSVDRILEELKKELLILSSIRKKKMMLCLH